MKFLSFIVLQFLTKGMKEKLCLKMKYVVYGETIYSSNYPEYIEYKVTDVKNGYVSYSIRYPKDPILQSEWYSGYFNTYKDYLFNTLNCHKVEE